MTDFERRVLAAIRDLGDDAYGVPLRKKLNCSYGALYVALDALEEDGVITSTVADGGPERGGRAKRFWRVRG